MAAAPEIRRYSLAVDIAARRLSKDEEAALRRTGTLPDWFFDVVENERRNLGSTGR